jgi:hypothetical protein
MTTFQTKKNVMKNQGQANNLNNLIDPTVANDPQAQAEFGDLPISGEHEERVIGGITSGHKFVLVRPLELDGSLQRSETESSTNWMRVMQSH